MICDKSIKLSKCELAFLRKGPKFMLRQAMTENDFCTEINKMIVKDKYEQLDKQDVDPDDTVVSENEQNRIREAEDKLMAEAGITYDKETRVIDMGKFRATNYKFNKMVHLPEAESMEREARHEIRKAEMLKIFRDTCAKIDNMTKGSCNRSWTNLTQTQVLQSSHGRSSIAGKQPVSQAEQQVKSCHGSPSIASKQLTRLPVVELDPDHGGPSIARTNIADGVASCSTVLGGTSATPESIGRALLERQ